jgi:hypothetical protein
LGNMPSAFFDFCDLTLILKIRLLPFKRANGCS